MSREIKFRVWNKEQNRMIIPESLATIRLMLDFCGNLGTMDINNDCEWMGIVPKGTYEICQYTGLKDRNGVEIYEGDIFIPRYNGFGKKVVKYKDGKFNISEYDSQKCEVIGNIFENKNLMEGTI